MALLSHILADNFAHVGGCKRGDPCSSGQTCTSQTTPCYQEDCSFERCQLHAIDANADGFTYGDKINGGICRLCTNSALENIVSTNTDDKNWGVYGKLGT